MLRVSDIQRFCLQDGPGIRTTVFLQGCALRCWWCQNADLQPAAGGTLRDAAELVEELGRDARYWRRSGGGVTLSGGEPLRQAQAAGELLGLLGGRGVHRCVETSGAADSEVVANLSRVIDLWLFDLKAADASAFEAATGGELAPILANLANLLSERPDSVWVRVPLIAGFNDDERSVEQMRRFLASHPCPAKVQVLPGHALGTADRRDPAVAPETCTGVAERLSKVCAATEICW